MWLAWKIERGGWLGENAGISDNPLRRFFDSRFPGLRALGLDERIALRSSRHTADRTTVPKRIDAFAR